MIKKYSDYNTLQKRSKMGNKIFEKVVDSLIDLVKREIFPVVDENLKPN